MTRTVAVVGGGIAGMTAAHVLASRGGIRVVVLEADSRLGGKLRTEPFADGSLDAAADSFLARRPEGVDLCRELGVDDLVAPAASGAYIWSRGALRPIPAGTTLGVPTDFGALARSGVLSPAGLARAALEPWLPGRPMGHEETLGAVVRRRYGAETARRLVDPLVGGINAGDTDRLGIDSVAPQIAVAARRRRSLTRALRAARPAPGPASPVFLAPTGGMEVLIDRLARSVRDAGGELHTAEPVSGIEPAGDGRHRLTTPSGPLEADGVVLAVPAFVAAPLVAARAPSASSILDGIDHASVVLVALAYPADASARPLDASGFLVPRDERLLMTACSWSSTKWAHLARPGRILLRVSAGRHGDDRALGMPDDELVARLGAELATTMGLTGGPTAARVNRWPRGFPQYAPGHGARVAAAAAEIEERLPGVVLAGAALGGVGVPACIATGRDAAARVSK